jgi:hypothetical protein
MRRRNSLTTPDVVGRLSASPPLVRSGQAIQPCLQREDKLSSRAEEYLENAERCEFLAKEEADTRVRAALIRAARQWRDRALLDQHAYAGFATPYRGLHFRIRAQT